MPMKVSTQKGCSQRMEESGLFSSPGWYLEKLNTVPGDGSLAWKQTW